MGVVCIGIYCAARSNLWEMGVAVGAGLGLLTLLLFWVGNWVGVDSRLSGS